MNQLPHFLPSSVELSDLELILNGGLAPLTGFNQAGNVSIELPATIQAELTKAGKIILIDPEGMPLAELTKNLEVIGLRDPEMGPFRHLRLPPATVKATHPEALTVPVATPITGSDIAEITATAAGSSVVLLALAGPGTPQDCSPVGLVRSCLAAAKLIPNAAVVVVALANHQDPELDHQLGLQVVQNYAAGNILALKSQGELPPEVADAISASEPPQPGLVIFFTGLSGSGKSTLARALYDRILETGNRSISILDGDLVRRQLSSGLSFSTADRETNIRRIGWVAAEIARHGGLAICSPIAPFASTRSQVAEYVTEAGGDFFLIHVSTPLAECERRDKKGMYAKARAGEIPEFTGISSPYEIPDNADLSIDTSEISIEAGLDQIWTALMTAGFEL